VRVIAYKDRLQSIGRNLQLKLYNYTLPPPHMNTQARTHRQTHTHTHTHTSRLVAPSNRSKCSLCPVEVLNWPARIMPDVNVRVLGGGAMLEG